MNTQTTFLLLALAAIAIYAAIPHVTRWWNTARPTQCPACRRWKPVANMTLVRHTSGLHIRICEPCYHHLYTPFAQDHQHDRETAA